MKDDIKVLLGEQIASEFGELANLDTGTEEHARAVDDLVKLYKLRIDEAERTIERYLKYGVEIAGIILPLGFYARWMTKGFKFEETGALTSTTFRELFRHFRPTGR